MENPRDSYMWWCPGFRQLAGRPEVAFVHFQHCAFGGSRPKWGGLLHYPGGAFDLLARTCPGEGPQHQHEPWGRTKTGGFATAAETVYPTDLCEKMADCVFTAVNLEMAKPLSILVARGGAPLKRYRPVRAAAGRQARGGRGRPLLPEFKEVRTVAGPFRPADPRCRPGHSWTEQTIYRTHVPAGARTIRTFHAGAAGGGSRSTMTTSSTLPSRGAR